ncbi:MAG TPA: hypothetical protein VEA81_07075 [Burkholderiaceae bacterium]|nr:hypothetical protein [Burkholderiaceae bacterium]
MILSTTTDPGSPLASRAIALLWALAIVLACAAGLGGPAPGAGEGTRAVVGALDAADADRALDPVLAASGALGPTQARVAERADERAGACLPGRVAPRAGDALPCDLPPIAFDLPEHEPSPPSVGGIVRGWLRAPSPSPAPPHATPHLPPPLRPPAA